MWVTIDPGINSGWAIWSLRGLVACGLGDPRLSDRHVVVGVEPQQDVIHDVWIEGQIIYPRSKVDPNDIVKLAQDAGRWAGRYDSVAVDTHFVLPAAWKGQVPKDIHHARVWAKLSTEEQEIVSRACRGMAVSKRHNVLDAVGLGVWVRITQSGLR